MKCSICKKSLEDGEGITLQHAPTEDCVAICRECTIEKGLAHLLPVELNEK